MSASNSRGTPYHELSACVFCEGDFTRRLGLGEFGCTTSYEDTDELCEQLYMDRLGHGVNGAAVTRPRR